MYNHRQVGEEATRQRLLERTRAFFRDADIEDEGSLKAFREAWEDGASEKLMTGLPSCPFLGYVNLNDERDEGADVVGCLVHPLQNDGIDGRDCGVYDRFICEDYLCAAHDVLSEVEVRWILETVDDSYLYGLAITNPKYVKKLLELVAQRVGTMPDSRVLEDEAVLEAGRACFELLRDWPYRDGDGIFGQVKVAGALETSRRAMPADQLDVDPEPVDALLACLGSQFETVDELHEGRRSVDGAVDSLAQAVEASLP